MLNTSVPMAKSHLEWYWSKVEVGLEAECILASSKQGLQSVCPGLKANVVLQKWEV